VGPDPVVLLAPSDGSTPGLVQRFEPMLLEVLVVTELAVEASDITVLHGAPGWGQDVANAVGLFPCHECPVGELGATVISFSRRPLARLSETKSMLPVPLTRGRPRGVL
jgi:hypothetical protein